MEWGKLKGLRAFFAVIVVFALVVSVLLSVRSFTGYVVSDEVDVVSNTFAVVLLLIGIIGAYFLRHK